MGIFEIVPVLKISAVSENLCGLPYAYVSKKHKS